MNHRGPVLRSVLLGCLIVSCVLLVVIFVRPKHSAPQTPLSGPSGSTISPADSRPATIPVSVPPPTGNLGGANSQTNAPSLAVQGGTPTQGSNAIVAPTGGVAQPAAGPPAPDPDAPRFDYVMVRNQKAHPTKLLAKFSPHGDPAALDQAIKGEQLVIARRYSATQRLVLLDAADKKPVTIGNLEEAKQKGKDLERRIAALRATGLFEFVEPDYIVSTQDLPADEGFGDGRLWGLRNTGQDGGTTGADIGAVAAWDITTGSTDVIVAVIDTGIRYTHQDLAAQMWKNPGEIPGNGIDDDADGYIDNVFGINAITGSGDPMDDNDHGSHTAGTIGAAANNGRPHVGVTWHVRLMACKFLSSTGSGSTSDAIECISFAASKGARILSNSWGGGGYSEALYAAIAGARDQGALFVAAAGNDGRNMDRGGGYPATYELDNVISVAALDRKDTLADFSNYGSLSTDLGAPGVAIFSTTSQSDSSYAIFRGTSMACPHVSGVAALVIARYPGIELTELRQRLLSTVVPIPALTDKTVSGGRVNAFRALSAVPDGVLEVTLSSDSGGILISGSTAILRVTVTDLRPVTDAIVTGTLQGLGELEFLNTGTYPDEKADDHVYTAVLTVPPAEIAVNVLVNIVAPGKQAATLSRTFPIEFPPPNDRFANRTVLEGSSPTATGSNVGATFEASEPTHGGFAGFFASGSVWWTWTAPSSSTVTMNTGGSSFDTILAVYTGNVLSSLHEVASDDDGGGLRTSSLRFSAVGGTQYQIAVVGAFGAIGDIRLNIIQNAPTIPAVFTQPKGRLAAPGSSVTFTVVAGGAAPLSYLWKLAGNPIAGATSPTLLVSPVTQSSAGAYTVEVKNSLGSVTSQPAILTVVEVGAGFFEDFDPDIDPTHWSEFKGTAKANDNGGSVSSPNSLWFAGTDTRSATTRAIDVSFGGTIAFSLRIADGQEFPWEVAELPGDAIVFEFSTDAGAHWQQSAAFDNYSFTSWDQHRIGIPPAAQTARTLFRWRQLENGGDCCDHWAIDDVLISAARTPMPVSIIRPLADLRVESGTDVTLSIEVEGTAPITYQWYFNGSLLPSRTGPQLPLGRVSVSQSGVYRVDVDNPHGPPSSVEAQMTVVPALSLAEALDTTSLTWRTGGQAPWQGRIATSHDGVDAGRSGTIGNDKETWVETTLEGPGLLKFWWKVSSEYFYDYLFFVQDEELEAEISGEVDWNEQTFYIAEGTHTVQWLYAKDGDVAEGQDRAWLDEVSYIPGGLPPVITSEPTAQTITAGDIAEFEVKATGHPVLRYRWQRGGVALSGQTRSLLSLRNAQPTAAGEYSVVVSNTYGSVTSSNATLTILPAVPLPEALDAPSLTWFTSGAGAWFGQTAESHDGADAARTSRINDNEEVVLRTSVQGPGLLSFWWKVSSEDDFDGISFNIGSTSQAFLSGEKDWESATFFVAEGSRLIRWIYSKDSYFSAGQDRGWVDQVVFTPDGDSPPVVYTEPTDQTQFETQRASLTVVSRGARPLTYQWKFQGVDVPGAKSATLTFPQLTINQTGLYTVAIANQFGSTVSREASLKVIPAIPAALATDAPDLEWTTGGQAVWFGQAVTTFDGTDAMQSGSLGDSQTSWIQTSVVGPGTIKYQWKVSSEEGFDELRFLVAGARKATISGEVNWASESVAVPAGAKTLRWTYAKDEFTSAGSDHGWLDAVSWQPVQPTLDGPSLRFSETGRLQVQILAPAGSEVVIETSESLVSWQPISTNLVGTAGSFLFEDPRPNPNQNSTQYFRALRR